ncbi:hypothetical protein LTR84_003297 [Exophiala bonariae]|uniref:DNA-directed RNA polymerase RBP11-like dimerisation domain-containing protein n=1 Tax=Exophiala bonariae TaxID=1690606 RepID=A0AAV9N6Q5_9EURO|nr:hypothetical protein LTR84_003297 [Exophiala bonariae]
MSLPRAMTRNANGAVSELQDQKWRHYPKNLLYRGNGDSTFNDPSFNQPDPAKTTVSTVCPNTAASEDTEASQPPSSFSSAASISRLPREGKDGSWKHHPSHKLYQSQDINHLEIDLPDTTESFLLDEGEKKIEEKIDTRTPNTTIFTFNKEDHTLANLLRDKLLKNSHVTFAAYRVPHPLFAKFELRVQTDGEITPKEAVLASCRDTIGELNTFKSNFTREYELRKMVGSGGQNGK